MRWLALTPLSRTEKALVFGFFFVILPLLGAIVEKRSAFMVRRMGDLDCFLRAGWAVRHGADLYAVTSDNDWHYNYPPFYAILMTPLADPPRGEETAGHVPYVWSVLICYLISVFALLWSADVLATAIEEHSSDNAFRSEPTHCRRWWYLRLWPLLICCVPIGHTLMRGQVNLIVLALLCLALAGWVRGQSFRAGWWLASAICIKVIPAYLLVYPAWKRDLRALVGCGAGLLFGLVLLPLAVFGPEQTVTHYQTYGRVFLGPMFQVGDDDSRKEEIVGVNATDSIGVKNMLHNWMYPDRQTRPQDLHIGAKIAYLLLGFVMTLVVLWPSADTPWRRLHQLAALIVLMTIFSPVSHSHYLAFCVPLTMMLIAWIWEGHDTITLPWWLAVLFAAFLGTQVAAQLPGLEVLKDRCAAMFATLPLWALSVAQLWRDSPSPEVSAARDLCQAA